MSRKFQLNYSELKPSVYESNERIKKANKTTLVLKDYLKKKRFRTATLLEKYLINTRGNLGPIKKI